MKSGLPKINSLQQKAADPVTSAWVEASAGTGKTKVLVDRVLRLLLHGNQPSNILCLTYTRSAAAEMQERLNERLLSWSTMSKQALQNDLESLTARAVDSHQLGAAETLYERVANSEFQPKFHTIHSFCETLLRRFPQEAGVDTNFTILDEHGAKTLLRTASELILQQLQGPKSNKSEGDISCISQYVNNESFSRLLDLLVADRWRLEKFLRNNDENRISCAIAEMLGLSRLTSPDLLVQVACANTHIDAESWRSSVCYLQAGSKTDHARAQTIDEWISASQHTRRELFEKYCAAFLTRDQLPIKTLVSASTLAKKPDALLALRAEQSRLLEITTKIKRAKIVQCSSALLNLTKKILEQFSQEKIKQNCLDYNDLIIKSGIILTSADVSSWVLYKVDRSVDHLLIDEAQDTSLDQWEIIRALASEFFAGEGAEEHPRTIFAVGDYKQSIYSFQRANPESFNKMRDYFRDRANNASAPWADIGLQVSFRSTSPILESVDLVFDEVFAAPVEFSDETLPPLKHFCWRDGAPGLVEVWPIIQPSRDPKPAARRLPTHVSAERSSRTTLAQIVASKINEILSDSRRGHSNCFLPEDIMVLVRRRGPFVLDLLKALKNLKIPVTGLDGMALTDNIAVMDLISVGHFLLNPDDDLSLAEVLKSPLCNLGDEDLFKLAHNRHGSIWHSLCDWDTTNSQFQEARFLLEDLIEKSKIFTPSELYADLLLTRNYKKYFVSKIGIECIDPINAFLNKSIEYEAKNNSSLEGFIHWFENNGAISTREPALKRNNAVKILTVHGAKGLESPVVFLPDTVQKSRAHNPVFWPDKAPFPIWIPNATLLDPLTRKWVLEKKKREAEEYKRLLYVAMTRAKDQLYICGWSETSNIASDCWHTIVSQTLEKVVEETDTNIPDSAQKNGISSILRLANFTPGKKTIAYPGPPFKNPTPLPTWINSNLTRHDHQSIHRTSPTFGTSGTFMGNKQPIEALIAQLVDSLYHITESEREQTANKFVSRLSYRHDTNLLHAIKEWALKILGTKTLSFLFQDNTRGCLPISGPIRYRERTLLFHETIERLVDSDDSLLLVNFLVGNNSHTNRPGPPLPAAFLRKIAVRASLAKLVFPQKDVTSAILWVDEQKLQHLSSDLLKKCLS
ncbi:MAG: double-strand break repair helicase AddA [Rhodospirillaceae bacterium]|nr:double-strand break repair helicase AddA [Rhodospirillaceae bacterium]|tara:strand:+ start:3921 stop:7343 length:3423 start_codon:yes stop_codon:yes gene_type:complete